jgi:hypothetical protein
MNLVIPLQQMSVEDKLQAIEEIWSDLVRTPENIPSPSWHADVLSAREKRIENGTARFLDIEEAKRVVRERIG